MSDLDCLISSSCDKGIDFRQTFKLFHRSALSKALAFAQTITKKAWDVTKAKQADEEKDGDEKEAAEKDPPKNDLYLEHPVRFLQVFAVFGHGTSQKKKAKKENQASARLFSDDW